VLATRGRWTKIVAIGAAGLAAAATAAILVSPLRSLNDDPPSLRIHLWEDALRMIAARPLTGWGEDTTGLAFGAYLAHDYAQLVSFDRTHSGPLEIAATQGLLGLAALGWVLVVLAGAVWRDRHAGEVAALGAACAGYSVWVLFNFDWAPATGAFWLLAGTAWSMARAAGASPVPAVAPGTAGPVWRTGLAVLLVLAAAGTGALPLLADRWYQQGRSDLSVLADPLQAQYHWARGRVLVDQGAVELGIDELRLAAALGETAPDMYVELGDREAQLGQDAQARADYLRALHIDPFYLPATQRLRRLTT
jgi:hypothetical protein